LVTGFVVMALITLQDAFHPIKVAESLLYLDKCGYRQWPTLAADGQVEIGKRLGLIGAG
jgi:hypothetical protein